MDLSAFNQMYKHALQANLNSTQKDRELARIMTLMEQTYNIPMIRNAKWETENKEIIDLYYKISLSRNL